MADSDNPFLDGSEPAEGQGDQSGSALRKFGNEQKKRADDLAKELADLKADLAKRQASDVFAKLGINEKVRKFYSGEPTEDAIQAWWKENAEVFGVEPGSTDPTLTDEQKAQQGALADLQRANQFGQDRPDAMSSEAAMQVRNKLMSTKGATDADFAAALRALNIPDLPISGPVF